MLVARFLDGVAGSAFLSVAGKMPFIHRQSYFSSLTPPQAVLLVM